MRGRRLLVVVAAALAAGLLVHARAWEFLCDDAYISFRYARNLAEHGALEYNLGERVEGYTNFLWVLVLALGAQLGAPPEALAPWLTQLGALAGAAALVVLIRGLRGASAPWTALDLLPALLLAAAPEYVVWAQGGLETSWAAALVLAAMAALTLGRWRAAGIAAALAGLTRLDALLPLGVFVLTWAIGHVLRGSRDRLPRPGEALRAGLWAALPLLGHLAFRALYYGELLPNTWAIKRHGALLRGTFGVAYLKAWAAGIGLVWISPLVALLRPRHAALVLPIAANLAYAWSIGGDFMAYGRFLALATALTAGLVAWLVIEAAERALGRRAAAGALVAGVALAAGLATTARARWQQDRTQSTGWIDGRWEGVTAMDRFARERVRVGAWLREHVPADTRLSVGAAGALPYASGLPAIDVFGLVDPWPRERPEVRPQVQARPGHQLQAPLSVVLAREPALLCHLGYVGARRPSPASAMTRGVGRDYVWACAEPEPTADAREPSGVLDVGYYCCLRRRGRTVGVFSDAEAR